MVEVVTVVGEVSYSTLLYTFTFTGGRLGVSLDIDVVEVDRAASDVMLVMPMPRGSEPCHGLFGFDKLFPFPLIP
jgi:hypothetical protein